MIMYLVLLCVSIPKIMLMLCYSQTESDRMNSGVLGYFWSAACLSNLSICMGLQAVDIQQLNMVDDDGRPLLRRVSRNSCVVLEGRQPV